MSTSPSIVGAGLAGLLAAHAFPRSTIFEAAPARVSAEHKALLRFRSEAVAHLTGIDFREVTVRKGIWFGGKFVQPSIGMANLYARKVTGALTGDRSIWNLDPVTRWIAPEDFYERLLENVGARIRWETPFNFAPLVVDTNPPIVKKLADPVINTAPMPLVLKESGIPLSNDFQRAPIQVVRWRVDNCDAHQTVYFPDPRINFYRASLTGSLLIAERMAPIESVIESYEPVLNAFGLIKQELEPIDNIQQKYGKIVPLPDSDRKALLHRLTAEHNIFSLGRFACWRNILLDDVVADIAVLRRLLKASEYDRRRHAS